nr:chaperone protein DnaJ 49-like [Ipomoea batatas]
MQKPADVVAMSYAFPLQSHSFQLLGIESESLNPIETDVELGQSFFDLEVKKGTRGLTLEARLISSLVEKIALIDLELSSESFDPKPIATRRSSEGELIPCQRPTLKVKPNPEPTQVNFDLIKTRFEKLCAILSPKENHFALAEEAYRLVVDAWLVLSVPAQRALFDEELKNESEI